MKTQHVQLVSSNLQLTQRHTVLKIVHNMAMYYNQKCVNNHVMQTIYYNHGMALLFVCNSVMFQHRSSMDQIIIPASNVQITKTKYSTILLKIIREGIVTQAALDFQMRLTKDNTLSTTYNSLMMR